MAKVKQQTLRGDGDVGGTGGGGFRFSEPLTRARWMCFGMKNPRDTFGDGSAGGNGGYGSLSSSATAGSAIQLCIL